MNSGGSPIAVCANEKCGKTIMEGQRHIATREGPRFCGESCFGVVTGYGKCVVCGSLDAKLHDDEGHRITRPMCDIPQCVSKRASMSTHAKLKHGLPARRKVRARTPQSQENRGKKRPRKRGK